MPNNTRPPKNKVSLPVVAKARKPAVAKVPQAALLGGITKPTPAKKSPPPAAKKVQPPVTAGPKKPARRGQGSGGPVKAVMAAEKTTRKAPQSLVDEPFVAAAPRAVKSAPKPPATVARTKASKAKTASRRAEDPFLARELEKYGDPLPSREFTLQILAEQGVPLWPVELMKLLGILPEEEDFFARRINAMERDGQIMLNRKGAICVADKLDLIAGKISAHPDGFGFCVPDEPGDDLFLTPREMEKVMHGDRVLVREAGKDARGRREGKIVEVLERGQHKIVGRVISERGVMFVQAEDRRIHHEILLPKSDNPHLPETFAPGQVVMVELIGQPNRSAKPIGKIIEVLGHYADPGMEIEIALRKHDLPHVFSAEVLASPIPEKVKKKEHEGREDLRKLPLVTIDGETARDFDDAVFAERKGKGWRLVVAIADVSHYVTPGSPLDKSALERGNSVYFPRRVIPMLPEGLSNGICSLNPEVERLAMVCDMQISAKGKIKAYKFYPAVFVSHARLTYTQVAAWLAGRELPAEPKLLALMPHLHNLHALFQALLGEREERGAIDFDSVETRMNFDENGKISSIVPVVRNDAHRLIEECMLAANVCAADFLLEAKQPVLFRNHESPTLKKLENLRVMLRDVSLMLEGGDKPTAKDYGKVLKQVRQRPDGHLLQTVLLRSMQQAQYGPDNIGHFGLGYEAYAHFTSPIRRYPDLLVHRAIKAVLAGKKYKPASGGAGTWVQLGEQCSMTERRADEATRDVENWLKCYFLQDKLGEILPGTISAVTSFGVFVLLDGVYVEGLVHISELGRDYYQYDAARHLLRGEKTGHTYHLGDRLTVQVAKVDLETSRADFVLAVPAGLGEAAVKPSTKAHATPTVTARKPRTKSTAASAPAGNLAPKKRRRQTTR